MKIAIDGVGLTKQAAGVADITVSIVNSILKFLPEYEVHIISHKELHPSIKAQLILSEKLFLHVCPAKINIGLFWSVFKLNIVVNNIEPDFFLAVNSTISPLFLSKNIRVITYIHDMVFKEFPQTMNWKTRLQMNFLFPYTVKRANHFWTNSLYSKEVFQKYYSRVTNEKIFVGSGINPCFLSQIPSTAKKSDINKYLIFVGTVEPRKNIQFLLKLFSSLDESYNLVIVGKKGWGRSSKEINEILSEDNFPLHRVKFTGFVSTQELISYYKGAYAFISTSFNEGLGLPQIEAMACGCPVICSHNSAMVEVVDNVGITIKTWEVDDWTMALNGIKIKRDVLIKNGYEKIGEYNWSKVIKAFDLEVLRRPK